MVYTTATGEIVEKRPWTLSRLPELFWAVVNFFGLFFGTLFTFDAEHKEKLPKARTQRDGGWKPGRPNVQGIRRPPPNTGG